MVCLSLIADFVIILYLLKSLHDDRSQYYTLLLQADKRVTFHYPKELQSLPYHYASTDQV